MIEVPRSAKRYGATLAVASRAEIVGARPGVAVPSVGMADKRQRHQPAATAASARTTWMSRS